VERTTGSGDLVKTYQQLYSGVVFDVLCHDIGLKYPYVVSRDVKPLVTNQTEVLFGQAVTCKGQRVLRPEHVDDSVRLKMFKAFGPGCIQVIDTDGDKSCAHFGDISGRIAHEFGCSGAGSRRLRTRLSAP
jgi:4-hydroxy-4-methyl-2-oxoglutarate aldolase